MAAGLNGGGFKRSPNILSVGGEEVSIKEGWDAKGQKGEKEGEKMESRQWEVVHPEKLSEVGA